MTSFSGWFLKYRYLGLCLLLFALMALRTQNHLWTGDFWEHSSVIRELSTHPLNPAHPQLAVDAPHPFYSPYHLILAMFERLSGRSPVEILEIAGLINLIIFLTGLYLFIPVFSPQNRNGVAFYALVLILLLWGGGVWNYSGFYHLRALGKILPFPSLIAMGVSLITLAINQQRINTRKNIWLLPMFILTWFVLLTHLFTFLFLATGLVAMIVGVRSGRLSEIWKMSALMGAIFLLAAFWPYYPFLELIFSGSAKYHASNQVMYQFVFVRVWPLLIGLGLLFVTAFRDWRNPLIWWFGQLLVVYILGGISGAYSYGRVISYLGMILQMVSAIYLMKFELWVSRPAPYSPLRQAVFSIASLILLIVLTYPTMIAPVMDIVAPSEENRLEKYYFLSQYTHQDDVIITPLSTSLVVPTFGGKVVAFDRPMPFIPDEEQRRAAVQEFFDPQTTYEERWRILETYQVDFILLEKQPEVDWESMRAWIVPHGEVIYSGKRFLLYRVVR